jgi:Tol biopolymer transport system component/imidazolonepropionase-like amidohydrolase
MRKLAALSLTVLLCVSATADAQSKKKEAEKKDPAAAINTPRSDARKVSFSTNEGTWMSVDVSPDGRTVVFDLLGDIYAMPIDGGTARAISSGPAYDNHPRFSPDGRTIAFTSDRGGIENIWLMDADGKNPRILSEDKGNYLRSAAWTPDGRYLIARKENANRAGIPPVELWMYHVHGGTGIKLTSSDAISSAGGPVASRDGRFIYFAARRARFSYIPDVSRGLWQIERYDRLTGESTQLTSGYGGASRPAISPDGKTLVFVSRRDADNVLVSRNLATGGETILMRGASRDEQEGFGSGDTWPNYAFSPDGRSLLFYHHGKIARLDLGTKKVTDVAFTANVEQWLAPRVTWQEKVETGPVRARILRWPNQSADGRSVVFDAFGKIWVQDLASGKASGAARRLVREEAFPQRQYSPAFSPDGKSVAFVTWSDADGGHIWKANVDGSAAPQKLTAVPGHYANPVFSPRGDRIVFVQGTGQEFRGRQPEEDRFFEVRTIAASGGESQFVTTVRAADTFKFHPQAFWSADGSRIYFRDPIEPQKPTDDPKNDLVSVRLDGTDKRKHLRFPAVGDIGPSPDEQWVVFTSRDNVYVTALPKIQLAEPPEVSIKEGSVPVWRLSDEAGGYVGWADGGKTITWSRANQFHRLPIDAAIRFVEDQKRAAAAEAPKKDDAAKKDDEEKPRVPKSESIDIAVTLPRSTPEGSVVFRNARVIPMKGESVLDAADVVVTGNRIAAVGPAGTLTIPAGAKEIDARGKTIIPGLIDAHAHLHYSGMELFPDTKWEYIANLAYGVTTTYDPSAPSLDVFAQAEMVEAGLMTGPRIYSSGDVLYGGQQTDIWAEVNNLDDARRQVRRMKAYGARMIKVYQQPRREQRIWFADASRQEKMLVTAEGAGEMTADMSMVLDGYTAFEHSLPVELQDDVIGLVAKSGTHYTPTLLVSYGGPWGELYFWQMRNPHDDPKLNRFVPHLTIDPIARRHPMIALDEYHFPTVARGVAEVTRAGGNTSLGAHGQLQGLGVHWELWAMAGEGGKGGAMTPMEALRAATISAADKLGFAPDLGSIESGKLADFIVLDADPLADIHNTTNIRWVVKNGEVYDAASMRQEWPRQRDLPRAFWQMAE